MAARQDDDEGIVMVSSSEPKSDDVAHNNSEANHELISSIAIQVWSDRLSSKAKSTDEKVMLNDLLAIWCVIASLLDPLFCYTLIVDQKKNCIRFDEKLRVTVLVLRSLMDFGYILLVVFLFRNGLSASAVHGGFCSMAKKYLLSSFAFDILAVLPLPQVVVFVLFRATKGSRFTLAIRTLTLVLIVQLFPRVFRLYSFLKEVRWDYGIVSNSARAKAIFNLILYMVASLGFGAFWYLFSMERKATCLQVRCQSHPYCARSYNNSTVDGFCIDNCSGIASSNNTAAFNFGILGDAFNSGIVYSTDFMWKLSYCFYWGLQNLSSLGQGLKTSGDIREIYFSVFLTVSGLLLFALLIGNVQAILQAKMTRQEEMRLKEEEEKEKEKEKEKEEEKKKEIKLMLNLIIEEMNKYGQRAEN